MTPRILVTGSRDWYDRDTVFRELIRAWEDLGSVPGTELLHGDCPTGADRIADELWRVMGWPVIPRPALWKVWGRKAGPLRNAHMVRDIGANLALAFIGPGSCGALGCARLAISAGIPVRPYGAGADAL